MWCSVSKDWVNTGRWTDVESLLRVRRCLQDRLQANEPVATSHLPELHRGFGLNLGDFLIMVKNRIEFRRSPFVIGISHHFSWLCIYFFVKFFTDHSEMFLQSSIFQKFRKSIVCSWGDISDHFSVVLSESLDGHQQKDCKCSVSKVDRHRFHGNTYAFRIT